MAEVSSPKATGGGGTAFEFKVQASFLATMLVNGRYPCLPAGKANFIRFQARQVGYQTDDILLQLETPSGDFHRLVAQVKVDITFTQGNKEFRDTLIAAWTDFKNTDLFDHDKDALSIISGPGSKKEIRHFRSLLSWSRSSASAEELFNKISTPNYASQEMRDYLGVIKALLKDHLGDEPAQDELWQFMKCLHWLSYDFDDPSSRDISLILSMIQLGIRTDSATKPEDIWAQLLKSAVDYNPQAGSLTRDSLVDTLGDSIADSMVMECPGIHRLREHTEGILAVVQTSLQDGTHLERKRIHKYLWDMLSDRRILLVSGVAGIGKSSTIKKMIATYANTMPTFILKADELDRPHLHQALAEIGVKESIRELSNRFGLFENKIFIVESLEKLLEADCHDAFHQLFQFLINDPSWIIILSCRSHALGTIRNEILIPQGISPAVVDIPLLSDAELQEVAAKHSGIDRLFHNESIKTLLKVPMYLSYTCLIDWGKSTSSIDELNVKEFEQILWDRVIRKDKQQRDGIHLRRERCFTEIAVTRAKNMTSFVSVDPFDAAALQQLEADDLIIRAKEGVAPAHDLFEDWAINRRIDSLFREIQNDTTRLFSEIGSEPAMRRGFRVWLVGQLTRQNAKVVTDFITHVSQNQSLPGFWRDEVIVAVLLSQQAREFFQMQKDALLSNDLKYLSRVIHLLRTACKEPDIKKFEGFPLSSKGIDFFKTTFLKPRGSGWNASIEFIYDHLDLIKYNHVPLIAGLLQDWVLGLEAGGEISQESRKVGLIAIHLVNMTRETYKDDFRKNILRVAFRVSSIIKRELLELFGEAINSSPPADEEPISISTKRAAQDHFRFYESIIDSSMEPLHCFHLCDSMPEEVVRLALAKWIRPPVVRFPYERHIGVEPCFGLEEQYGYRTGPPSAFQGPFLFLLQSHPTHGINLILELINTTTECYAHSWLDSNKGDPIPQITVRLNDGREIKQFISGRLWGAYRGLHTQPDVLQSSLMALEKWLFDLAEGSKDITGYFDQLLIKTNSCAITAVLCSVAAGHPEKLGKHILPLFRTKELIEYDRSRMMGESSIIPDVGSAMGFPEMVDWKIHIDEREKAAKMPHRQHHLELLALNLQTGSLKREVQQIIDEHRRCLPPKDSQTDTERTWRLALHRMDLRQYKAEKADEEGKVLIAPVPPEQDIQEMQSRVLPEIEQRLQVSYVGLWAHHEFHSGPTDKLAFENWNKAIEWAQETYKTLLEEPDEEEKLGLAGPIYIAALSTRDHLSELNPKEITWCYNILVEKISQGLNANSRSVSYSGLTDGTAAAASVLPLFIDVSDLDSKELRAAIFGSLSYPDPKVRSYAIQGAYLHLWPKHTKFAKSCLIGMIKLSRLNFIERQEVYNISRDWSDPDSNKKKEETVRGKYRKEKNKLKLAIVAGDIADDFDYGKITFKDYSLYDLVFVVRMLPVDIGIYDSEPLLAVIVAQTIIAATEDESGKRDRDRVVIEFIPALNDFTSFFVLKRDIEVSKRVCKPLIESIDDCPKFIAEFVESLIINADKLQSGKNFWIVWQLFAEKILDPDRIKSEYLGYHFEHLIKTMMLATVPWKSDANDWKPLSENPVYLERFCKVACTTSSGFEALLSLLFSIGSFYLPEAFSWMAKALAHIDVNKIFNVENNRFTLEALLRREIHMRANQIRSNSALQVSVLQLLDKLVDFGSSAAFQLRERIIRPPKRL